jgi:amidohydrolase
MPGKDNIIRPREEILRSSSLMKDEVTRLRRHFHKNPELSYKEYNTASFIEEYLDKYKFSYRKEIAGTGIIGRIDGLKGNGKVIAIRAEMDALPVEEKNQVPYSSMNKGIMHACGHDAHMAMLLGAMRILGNLRNFFGGTLLFIFQPGEEKSPGGARLLIESGELDNPKPDIVVAQHVLPELETGTVGYKTGLYMASCDEIYITISGTGGHAALPGLTTDQIFIASRLILKLKEEITAARSGNDIPTVLGIGRISGPGATNVIPAKVEIDGTFRTFDENWRSRALDLVRSAAAEIARESGVTIDVRIEEGYPVLVNDEILTGRAVHLSSELLGAKNVKIFNDIRMSSDDFSFYSQLAPTLYYRIGVKTKQEDMKKLHTPEFDIDEEGLETGVANISWLALNLLNEGIRRNK